MKSALLRPMGDPPPLLIAIDPGNDTGIAVFCKGILTDAWLVAPYEFIAMAPGYFPHGEVIFELPATRGPGSPVDPNDLVAVAVQAGYVARGFEPSALWYVKVGQWKGQRKKRVDNAYTLRTLSDIELARLPKLPKGEMHNVLDAVGIGLWLLGRTTA